MQIYGPASVHGAQNVSAPHAARTAPTTSTGSTRQVSDQLDLSPQATFVDQVNQLPDMRMDRVRQLRAEIAGGKYETEQKISSALDRLLDEMA